MTLNQQLVQQLSDKANEQITDKEFLAAELSMGISADNPDFVNLCDVTAKQLQKYSDIKSVLDYGAGTGVYSNAMHQLGYDVKIYENFKAHRDYIKEKYPHLTIINKPVTTDCLFWIEVSEHMTDQQIDNLFNTISPKYIYHSSTSEVTIHDELWGHINIKSQDDWVSLFKSKGYELIESPLIPTAWAKIYKKYE
jgi:2-polyprenyl-3-methyl-5-hydroxy-6-metoxy-1,4-benzoquinol methylase